jgi:hypothetical protein
MSPLLAQSGHHGGAKQCLLLGVKRTSTGDNPMSAFDPKRTWAACLDAAQFSLQNVNSIGLPMRRRQFIALFGSAVAAGSLAARKDRTSFQGPPPVTAQAL